MRILELLGLFGGCVWEEIEMAAARVHHGEPAMLGEILPSAWHHWRWLSERYGFCELCVDPIDKPHIDEQGGKRWRACPNKATREVLQHTALGEYTLNICEQHFKEWAS